jgi:hypothetical protein
MPLSSERSINDWRLLISNGRVPPTPLDSLELERKYFEGEDALSSAGNRNHLLPKSICSTKSWSLLHVTPPHMHSLPGVSQASEVFPNEVMLHASFASGIDKPESSGERH